MAAITYLPAPIKVENNHTDSKPVTLLWLASTIALGSLAYYAPKTFLATAIGIFAYQVYGFNQLVHTADNSKHRRIHAWAIIACLVMASIGSVFMLKSLPCVWSALKDASHFHTFRSIGHITKAVILFGIGASLDKFNASAKALASRHRWVEMEDYVENYPVNIKQDILSSYRKQFFFYLSALLPQVELARFFSAKNFAVCQFQPEATKFSILQSYFDNPLMRRWPKAIHQFQQLSVENQIALGPQLRRISSSFSTAERDALPDDVKAVILNQILIIFETIPSNQGAGYSHWEAFITAFENLPREQQPILGQELLRLIKTVPQASIASTFPETMRLAALKACAQTHVMTFGTPIFEGLTDPFKAEFGVFLQRLIENGSFEKWHLSPAMQAVLPRTE